MALPRSQKVFVVIFRFRDILVSFVLLALLVLPFQIIILLLAFSQERVFFFQERTGWKERPFRLIKFSTLRDISGNEKEADEQKKRLTPIGKFLRKFSLDELPQLWNVLKGDMSLVGPRPLIHTYLPLYSPVQRRRFLLKPGITGWAQVNGRNALTFTERFELDQKYLENRTFWWDCKIIWMTFTSVFSGKNIFSDEKTTSPEFDGTN